MIGEKIVYFLPCYMHINGKKISLTLNWYRNAHFQLLNKVKQAYFPTNIVKGFKAKKILISYTLRWNNHRKTDFMNWVAIADKFFLDWLVNMGFIPEDNIKNYRCMSATIEEDHLLPEPQLIAEVTILE